MPVGEEGGWVGQGEGEVEGGIVCGGGSCFLSPSSSIILFENLAAAYMRFLLLCCLCLCLPSCTLLFCLSYVFLSSLFCFIYVPGIPHYLPLSCLFCFTCRHPACLPIYLYGSSILWEPLCDIA